MFFEFECGGGDGCCVFGRVMVVFVIVVRVKVVDIRDDGVVVGEVSGVVLLFVDLVFVFGVFVVGEEFFLEFVVGVVGGDEFLDCFCVFFEFGGGEERFEGFEVVGCGFFEGWDGEFGERVLEVEYWVFGFVFDVVGG